MRISIFVAVRTPSQVNVQLAIPIAAVQFRIFRNHLTDRFTVYGELIPYRITQAVCLDEIQFFLVVHDQDRRLTIPCRKAWFLY